MTFLPNKTISYIANSFSICSKQQVVKVTGSEGHARDLPCSSASHLLLHSLPACVLSSHRWVFRKMSAFAGLCIWIPEVNREGSYQSNNDLPANLEGSWVEERDDIIGSFQNSGSVIPERVMTVANSSPASPH